MKRLNTLLALVCGGMLCMACASDTNSYPLIPYPEQLTPREGRFSLEGAAIAVDNRFDESSVEAVRDFAGQVASRMQRQLPVAVVQDAVCANRGLCIVRDTTLAAEGYRLDIGRRKAELRAATAAGVRYALQTVRQLLPVELFGSTPAPEAEWSLPCVVIDDAPRFAYRGLMLDVARHFFPVEEVERVIDLMALHKLNTLHWHLTDDQGWRIEIKRYPRLTEVGSIRRRTMIRKEWDNYDETPYGGFYTQDEIRRVVHYAAQRGIRIIPEIDLPGHMLAALACYPELGCTGGPYEVWGQWGVFEDVLCPGREETFAFIEGVLEEVMELFPSEYIHIGGDECPKTRWERCPACQARIRALGLKDDSLHTAEHYLQSYVTERVERFVASRGRRIIGWDEILEGRLAPDATVMSWRGSEGGIAAARMGHDAIMVPTSHFYFDYYQSRDTEHEPFGIGGYVPIEKVYSYEPLPDTLAVELQKHILGVQANLWTEYIATADHLEYMLLPRLAALSEVQWCVPGRREWPRFMGALPHILSIYDAMGCNFARTVFEVRTATEVDPADGCVRVTLSTVDDAPIRYTLDGSEPTPASALYTAPIAVRGTCALRARALREWPESRSSVLTFAGGKAFARPAQAHTAPHPRYAYRGIETLFDGLRGGESYSSGAWLGYYAEPLDVTVDLGEETACSSVTLGTLVWKGDWIFPPVSIDVTASCDGEHFSPVGRLVPAREKADDKDGVRAYEVRFPETRVRYVRVAARPLGALPAWHGGAGEPAFLFVDELTVQ